VQKRRLKSWIYYVAIYLIGLALVGGVAIFKRLNGTYTVADLWNVIVLPAVFALFMFLSDLILQKISDKKDRTNYEGKYLDAVSAKMQASNKFLIEDFRKLKESSRFQEALKYGFHIVQNGEDERFTVAHLERRFDSRSLEGRAMPYVVEHIREKLTDIQK
jgi:hypothetical protein